MRGGAHDGCQVTRVLFRTHCTALCENRGWIGGRPFNANQYSLCEKQCSQTIRFGLESLEKVARLQHNENLVICSQSLYLIPISAMRWDSQLPDTSRGCQASSNLPTNAAPKYPNISYFGLSPRMIMLAERCKPEELLFTFSALSHSLIRSIATAHN